MKLLTLWFAVNWLLCSKAPLCSKNPLYGNKWCYNFPKTKFHGMRNSLRWYPPPFRLTKKVENSKTNFLYNVILYGVSFQNLFKFFKNIAFSWNDSGSNFGIIPTALYIAKLFSPITQNAFFTLFDPIKIFQPRLLSNINSDLDEILTQYS